MFQQVLAALPAKPPKVHLGPGCQRYLRDHGVPESLITTLDECTYAGDIPIGRLWLLRLESSMWTISAKKICRASSMAF